MSEQHPHELAKDVNAILHSQRGRANDDDRPENISHQQAPAFENFHPSFNTFTLSSNTYDYFSNAGTIVNYPYAFQPLHFDPHHMHAYSGAHPSNIHAPAGFFTVPIPEQLWTDEIHPSYIPVGSQNFDWTPPDARSCGLLIDDTPLTNPTEQVVYANTPTTPPIEQYLSLETAASEAGVTQYFVADTIPRHPLQQPTSTRPASVAFKVRNERIKKEVSTLLYDNADHTVHKPMRISKTKKPEKVNNNVKQEACWRCKRYRKAVSFALCKHKTGLKRKVYWARHLQRMLHSWISSLALGNWLQEGSNGGLCRENNAL